MTTDIGQLEAGEIIDGKYRIVRLLGTGGMGAVYEGENLRIRRRVAIKMLHANIGEQAEMLKRFEREAQAAALVGSEHICEVLDLGVLADDTRYMVMEYLDGETLGSRIEKNVRLAPLQSIPLLVQVLEALSATHAAGIIHRDLKPDNIFILPQRSGTRDFVKILDFGVSKFSPVGGDELKVTRAGALVGTPYYMSPEQVRGSPIVDARSDIYAIGVLLYQATTGAVPFHAETFNELLFKIVLEPAPLPETYVPDLDPEFSGIIQKAMARDPAQRFQTCAELRDALLAYYASRTGGYPTFGVQASRPSMPQLSSSPPLDGNRLSSAPSGQSWPVTAQMNPSPRGSGGWGTPPGASPSVVPPMPAPSATADSWGHASSSVTLPKSRTKMVIGIFAGLGVLGALIGGLLLLGKPSGGKTATAVDAEIAKPPASALAATPPPPPPQPAAVEAPTVEPASVPSTAAVVASSSAKAAPSALSGAKSLSAAPAGAKNSRPAGAKTAAPAKPSGNDPGKPSSTDLGY
jgi:serine/threonine-protein kinase